MGALQKQELREKMKQHLQGICHLDEEAEKIHKRIYQQDWWWQAEIVAVTVSTAYELDTRAIIEAAWGSRKHVVVPKCFPKNRRLDFREIIHWNQLEQAFYELYEPKVDETTAVKKSDIDLIIVPGLLFDSQGYRVGFGGGYYDRFLEDCSALKVAQALDSQLSDHVPVEPHDIALDIIVTPSEVIVCSA